MKFKIYKKALYFGNIRIFKFTKANTKKTLHKIVWFTLLFVLFLTMIFGGIALIIGNSTTNQVITDSTIQLK